MVKITLETDYAIRIVDYLCRATDRKTAKEISESTNVTLRFSLKILRKLVSVGIARSYKGINGGYERNKDACDINIKMIVELIEGPIVMSRCFSEKSEICKRHTSAKPCPYHVYFLSVSKNLRDELESITFDKTTS